MDEKKQITYRLAEAVKDSGKTYAQLAEETGMHANTVSNYVNEGIMPGADKLAMLCRALGVSADTILGLDNVRMDKTEMDILIDAISKYGESMQFIVALEELGELAKEITKYLRGKGDLQHIAEEMADVEIMLEQVKIMLPVGDMTKQMRRFKLERLAERIAT